MSQVRDFLFFVLCVCLLCIHPNFAQSKDVNQGARIEFYLEFAFAASETLRKFEDYPQVTLVCPDGKCTKKLSDRVWNSIPSGDELQFAKNYIGAMEIALIPNLELGKSAANAAEKVGGVKAQSWGDPRCTIFHFSKRETVVKFIVVADPNEGDEANAICFAMEMMKGSGLGYWKSYDQMLRESPENQKTYMKNAGALLKFHWSTLVQPGVSRQDAREAWRIHFGL